MVTVAQVLRGKEDVIYSIQPERMVYDALVLMSEKQIGALPVMEGGALVGIISERDYARKVVLKGRDSRATTVRDIMTTNVICTDRTQSIEAAMKQMTEHNIRHLPVVADDEVIAIISMRDVVKAIISDQQALIEQMQQYITGGSLPE